MHPGPSHKLADAFTLQQLCAPTGKGDGDRGGKGGGKGDRDGGGPQFVHSLTAHLFISSMWIQYTGTLNDTLLFGPCRPRNTI